MSENKNTEKNEEPICRAACAIELRYRDGIMAKAINYSVKIDNYSFLSSDVSGNILVARAEAQTVPSLLHTLDDFLACVSAAENTYNSLKG